MRLPDLLADGEAWRVAIDGDRRGRGTRDGDVVWPSVRRFEPPYIPAQWQRPGAYALAFCLAVVVIACAIFPPTRVGCAGTTGDRGAADGLDQYRRRQARRVAHEPDRRWTGWGGAYRPVCAHAGVRLAVILSPSTGSAAWKTVSGLPDASTPPPAYQSIASTVDALSAIAALEHGGRRASLDLQDVGAPLLQLPVNDRAGGWQEAVPPGKPWWCSTGRTRSAVVAFPKGTCPLAPAQWSASSIPWRADGHGMTMGELARFANDLLDPRRLTVVPALGCDGPMSTRHGGLPGFDRRPTCDLESALHYPGRVCSRARISRLGAAPRSRFR